MADEQTLYRVAFTQEDKIYEVYARYVSEESLMGFIEIEDLVFSNEAGLVVDPGEEKLRAEFLGVKRSYVPMHLVLRIDEVLKKGLAKITKTEKKGNVHSFPGKFRQKPPTED